VEVEVRQQYGRSLLFRRFTFGDCKSLGQAMELRDVLRAFWTRINLNHFTSPVIVVVDSLNALIDGALARFPPVFGTANDVGDGPLFQSLAE